MDWIICLLCAFPLWGAVLLYWLTNWLQKRRYTDMLRSDHYAFVKTRDGDLIRKGQSSRNWLALFFLGSLQFVFVVILYQSLLSDPISWAAVIIVGLMAIVVAWLIVYFFRLERVPPIYFDTQLKEIRFNDGKDDYKISFADVDQIAVYHAGPKPEDAEKAHRSTYTIALPVRSSQKSLEVARITGRSFEKNTLRKDELVELIDSVIQVGGEARETRRAPLQALDAQILTPVESRIAQNLRRIQKEGGDGSFVIFSAGPTANYFIQIAGQRGDDGLYAEAAGNRVIAEGYQLSQAQNDLLETLGWLPPADEEMNYHRTWQASSHEERLMTAQEIMQAFVEVYGIDPEQPLDVEINLA